MYYIVSISVAATLDMDLFLILATTIGKSIAGCDKKVLQMLIHPLDDASLATRTSTAAAIAEPKPASKSNSKMGRIPRPRNQFIIYRQWMSARLQAENPGLTAGSICEFPSSHPT